MTLRKLCIDGLKNQQAFKVSVVRTLIDLYDMLFIQPVLHQKERAVTRATSALLSFKHAREAFLAFADVAMTRLGQLNEEERQMVDLEHQRMDAEYPPEMQNH